MISLSRIILSLGRWTSKTLSVHFFARRMPTPFVLSELPDQKTLYTESFPFNHRTWERDWDGHSTPFHLVSWRKPQSSLLLVAVSTISALRPLIVPTFILPVRNSSSFGVWILFFLRRSHNSPRWQDRPRSRLPTQPRPAPAATRLLVPALAEISVWPVMREEWGEIFLRMGHLLTLTTTLESKIWRMQPSHDVGTNSVKAVLNRGTGLEPVLHTCQ